MSPLRKSALAWCLAATALAASALGGSFLYLQNETYADAEYVETNIGKVAGERNFKLEEARKAGYSDTEIANFISKSDSKSFDRNWSRIAIAIGIMYAIIMLGVVASTLMREARTTSAR